jgi:hypothetical protein
VVVRKVLLAVVAALVLLVGGVAYATNSAQEPTSTGGDNGSQVAGYEDADEPGETEDADEPGDSDGPGDTEDDD